MDVKERECFCSKSAGTFLTFICKYLAQNKNTLKQFILIVLSALFYTSQAQKTEIQFLSGRDKDHTIEWDFMCTAGRNSGKWTTIPVPSNWEFQGFGNYTYGSE